MTVVARIFVTALLMTGCITPESGSKPQSKPAAQRQVAPQASEVCYCGWAADPPGPSRLCAVWLKEWKRGGERQPVLAYQTAASCRLPDCRTFFASRTRCQVFEPWQPAPEPKPLPTAASQPAHEPCFCDYAPIEGDPRGTEACAIWKASDKYLREYHFTPACGPEVCRLRPFVASATYCRDGYLKFY